MKTTSWDELRNKRFTKKQIQVQDKWVKAKVLEMDLQALRSLAGKTQRQVSKALDVSQPRLSAMEKRADVRVSTLNRYVRALGGELEIVARFGDKSVRLHGV